MMSLVLQMQDRVNDMQNMMDHMVDIMERVQTMIQDSGAAGQAPMDLDLDDRF